MKKETAFRFIPELIGNYTHVMEMSANPKQLYIETAIRTLHMGAAVFQAIVEHNKLKNKEAIKREIQKTYDDLEETRWINYEHEILREIDTEYEAVKNKVAEGKFRDKEVIGFARLLGKNLKRLTDILEKIQVESDMQKQLSVEELIRRALRDYKRLVTTIVQEEENDG